ncbi:FG-GAP-like repeat-containing protein [Haloferula sp. A504]|uniref:FG-GAP-like repeat-containing protein n=1 Tax=Haloferula sp. A504 TaxID=3373601 RepID=UPI0031C1BC22|nr:FG-GAP-like repeat-containing protein [Verrucomicrobiaceae bacterium E54]
MKIFRPVLLVLNGLLMGPPANALEFTNVTLAAGIDHVFDQDPANLDTDPEHPVMTGGAVAEDFNGDGWVDLFVLQGGLSPNMLYINQGDGTFVEEAVSRGVGQTGRHTATCGADYDSDGDVDLLVVNAVAGFHLLLTNDGTGHFALDTTQFPNPVMRNSSASWADTNGDGLLDLAIGAWNNEGGGDLFQEGDITIYRNQGAGSFVAYQTIPGSWNYVPHFADLNGDGWVDLLQVADFSQTEWFFNNGSGIFLPGGSSDIENGMGVATGDPDNDGDLDIFMTAIRDENVDPSVIQYTGTGTSGNRFLRNVGGGEFVDATTQAGVRDGHWGWGAVFGDFDNDGDEDLYHVNGWPAYIVDEPYAGTPSVLFENNGSMVFSEVAASSGDAADTGQGRCVVSFDYDNDGDLDLFIVNNNVLNPLPGGQFTISPGQPVLLRNDTAPAGNWLKVRVAGAAPYHSHGMGVRLHCSLPGKNQMREINASSNYNGHGPYRIAHFGAGAQTEFQQVRAAFPGGREVWRDHVAVNQEIVIHSPKASVTSTQVDPAESVEFEIRGADLPAGAVVVWSYLGVDYANPATIQFTTPGAHSVVASVYADSSETELLWAERHPVEVNNTGAPVPSIARLWNEELLQSIRMDFPDPAVHARNLFHVSVAMWDAWAAYDPTAVGYIHREEQSPVDVEAARHEAISYAAYRVLHHRYSKSVNASTSLVLFDARMAALGYPTATTTLTGDSPAAVGNRVAAAVLAWGESDGSREDTFYDDPSYEPVNAPMRIELSGTTLADPNRWQPLRFTRAFTQNGLTTSTTQVFVGSHWGWVRPFALANESPIHLDPGLPPQLGGQGDTAYKQGNLDVIRFSSWLDPDDGVMIDISPKSKGLNSLGANDGTGHGTAPNPVTGEPYQEQWVKRADYGRVIAEFWADGPESETPPGHWNKLANQVADHPLADKRFRGQGPVLDELEWDVKLYFALNAALHDSAVAAWGCKRYYDYIRPISAIRHMSGSGILPEVAGLVEKITAESSAPGERHAALVAGDASIGDTAIYAWGGEPADPVTEYSGSEWILGVDWLPYQRDTFVTPAFAGYVSGHSTFSRAAAEVLAYFTGTPYFPGGLGSYTKKAGSLEFEYGPSTDVTLEWATYYDAADEAGISRLYGGIHVPADDGPGRIMGSTAGIRAMRLAEKYYDGTILAQPIRAKSIRNGGQFIVQADVIRGMYMKLQSSSDLTDWEDITEPQQILDPNPSWTIDSTLPKYFFRVVQQPSP